MSLRIILLLFRMPLAIGVFLFAHYWVYTQGNSSLKVWLVPLWCLGCIVFTRISQMNSLSIPKRMRSGFMDFTWAEFLFALLILMPILGLLLWTMIAPHNSNVPAPRTVVALWVIASTWALALEYLDRQIKKQ